MGRVTLRFVSPRYPLTFSHYEEVAKLPETDQDVLLAEAEQHHLSRFDFRRRVKEYSREKYPAVELPPGTFDVIYPDPPWRYEVGGTTPSREVENQYPTMALEEICSLPVPSADSAVLFLWTSVPKTEEALQVLKAWNFVYRSHAIWDKELIGLGHWLRIQHELLLVGSKGSFPTPAPRNRVSSVIRSKRTRHSEKPDLVYNLIEGMYPQGHYLELFARVTRPGWTSWGNELNQPQMRAR